MNFVKFLLELQNVGRGVVSFYTYEHDGNHLFHLMVSGKGKKGLFHKLEGEIKNMEPLLGNFINTVKTDGMDRMVGTKLLEELGTDDIEIDIKTSVNPNSGLASIGRKIGKKYPGQKLRIIVLRGV